MTISTGGSICSEPTKLSEAQIGVQLAVELFLEVAPVA